MSFPRSKMLDLVDVDAILKKGEVEYEDEKDAVVAMDAMIEAIEGGYKMDKTAYWNLQEFCIQNWWTIPCLVRNLFSGVKDFEVRFREALREGERRAEYSKVAGGCPRIYSPLRCIVGQLDLELVGTNNLRHISQYS